MMDGVTQDWTREPEEIVSKYNPDLKFVSPGAFPRQLPVILYAHEPQYDAADVTVSIVFTLSEA